MLNEEKEAKEKRRKRETKRNEIAWTVLGACWQKPAKTCRVRSHSLYTGENRVKKMRRKNSSSLCLRRHGQDFSLGGRQWKVGRGRLVIEYSRSIFFFLLSVARGTRGSTSGREKRRLVGSERPRDTIARRFEEYSSGFVSLNPPREIRGTKERARRRTEEGCRAVV